MKYFPVLRSASNSALVFSLMIAGGTLALRAEDISKNLLLQSQADQQDIRSHTAAIVTQVQGLIDELAANGISGDDNKVLQATKAALSNLSGPEMERVIGALQKAGNASDTTTVQQNAVSAYSGQKGIILQFQQILKEYAQRQAAYELPLRFKELSDRQTDNLRETKEVAARTVGQSAHELSSRDATSIQIVQSDQAAITSEVSQAQDQLNKAMQDSPGDEAKNMQQALDDLKTGKLQQALDQANNDMKSGSLLKAISDQNVARDELRRITKDLNPPTDLVDALNALAGNLAELIDSQKHLLTQTNSSISSKTMDAGLKDKQIELVDKADLLQQDLQTLSPASSGLVKDSITPMQMSRAQLGDLGGFPQAVPPQNDAIAKLEEAQKQLQQQVADAQKAEDEANKDPVAKLEETQKKIEAAIQQQQQISQQTNQAQNSPNPDPTSLASAQQNQSQLQTQTSALQQQTQALSLPASQALATAASAMNQAQKELTDPTTATTTQTDQTAALNALKQADQQLSQQIAQDQQPATDPNALSAATAALQKAEDETGNAQTDATPPASNTPDTAAASQALSQANQDAQTAANTPGLPQDAAQDVKTAQAEIAQGKAAADQKNAAGAASHAAAAGQALAQAQASVAQAQAAMAANAASKSQGPPGPPGPPGPTPGTPGHTSKPTAHIAGGDNKPGTFHGVAGSDKFIALASRKRAADEQSDEVKRPQEYGPMIDQYMKNLADQASSQ